MLNDSQIQISNDILHKPARECSRTHECVNSTKKLLLVFPHIIKQTPNDQLKVAISYYEIDIMGKTCRCGESSLMYSMMEVVLPCSHLHHLGMPFSELNPPEIVLNGSIPDEFYEIKEVSS